VKENAPSINKAKVGEDKIVGVNDLFERQVYPCAEGKEELFLVKLV
jgi:hypothetical protein